MLVFQNKGLIPEAAITTMGVNAKIGDNPIGQFGTGLKYAIAIILRLGGEITIYRGLKPLVFTLKTQVIRKAEFNIICMNGKTLGFTDQIGKNWEPWMAYRELASNARDEGGNTRLIEDEPSTDKTMTTIIVKCPELEKAHHDRHTMFLQTEALWSLLGVDVHPGESEFIFYRGIRVMKLDKKSLYTYNFTRATQLTEDRTILYPSLVKPYIAEAVMQSMSETFLGRVLNHTIVKDRLEHSFPYDGHGRYTIPSDVFMNVCDALKEQKLLVGQGSAFHSYYVDKTGDRPSPFAVDPTPNEELVLSRVIGALNRKGCDIDRDWLYFKNNLENGAVQVGGRRKIVMADRLLKGTEEELMFAVLQGRAALAGGGSVEQLSNFIIHGKWIPEELTKTARSKSSVEDMVF